MNSKHSVVFFSAGVILILGLVLIGIIPMNLTNTSNIIMTEPQQNITINAETETQLQEINPQNTILEKDDENVNENNNNIIIVAKPIDEMNCAELNEFIMSFEKGWGAAIPLYDERCL